MSLFRDQIIISDRICVGKRKIQSPIKTDSKLLLCPKCRKTWEWERNSNGIKKTA